MEPSCKPRRKFVKPILISAAVAVIAIICYEGHGQDIVRQTSLEDIFAVVFKAIEGDPGLTDYMKNIHIDQVAGTKGAEINSITIHGLETFHSNNGSRLVYNEAKNRMEVYLNVGIKNVSMTMKYTVGAWMFKTSGDLQVSVDEIDIEGALAVPTIKKKPMELLKIEIRRLVNCQIHGFGIINQILNAGIIKNLLTSIVSSQGKKAADQAFQKFKLPWTDPIESSIEVRGYRLF